MGGTRGKRVQGKKKPKAVKAKVTAKMNSKRRFSRMGKEAKKGHKGILASYLTRSQVLRRLQITLRDFRRLCILKGIYPRDPKKKSSGQDKAYYHIKDVSYLAHEPLLNKFREFKAFMKKVRKALNRGEVDVAKKRSKEAPTYTLDHLVRERYPRFSDALADLDDALSLVHLFARLPADGPIKPHRTEKCRQLALHWQYYVARSHSLSKVFVSIKGVYFQAEIKGQPITWVVPHHFTPVASPDIDFRVMLTFLEFYETLLKFVLFKLYLSDLALNYPPTLDDHMDQYYGLHMAAVRGTPLAPPPPPAGGGQLPNVKASPATTGDSQGHADSSKRSKGKAISQKRLEDLEEKLASMEGGKEDEEDRVDEDEEVEEGALAGPVEKALVSTMAMDQEDVGLGPEAAQLYRQEREERAKRSLFKGLRFFLAREVPLSWVHFVITSFGGEVGWEGEGSPFGQGSDSGVTHHVVDRSQPTYSTSTSTSGEPHGGHCREYVQPQWVFDSINARMLLPVDLYLPGKALPPHLSPFVDDDKEGYTPAYREQLDMLRHHPQASSEEARKKSAAEAYSADNGDEEQGEEEVAEEEQDEEEPDEVQEEERDGGKKIVASKGRKQQQQQEEEAKELALIMMPKKHKRLYNQLKRTEAQRKEEVNKLMIKRRKMAAPRTDAKQG